MIGFPGLGIEFQSNPTLWRITDTFALTWYGVIIAVGFLLAVLYCLRLTKFAGIKQDELLDMVFIAAPAGIIGARLYFVAFNWSQFSGDPLRILSTWTGGMAIHGGVIGAVIAAVLFCWVRRISIGAMLDIGAIGLLIGQAVGRWGNFVNGEVYGTGTDLPWRMLVDGREVHPLFLYESLWNVLGFLFLRLLLKHRKYNGQLFTLYVAWYGLGRGLLEGMRSPEYNLMLGDVLVSQLVALTSCVAALLLLFGMTLFRKHPGLLEWTAERDGYEERKKQKKAGVTPGEPETDELSDSQDITEGDDNDGGETQWDYSFQGDQGGGAEPGAETEGEGD
ncbi:MAG: prolipoprotein diacylglyceryl transferase [Oscillospiraceae bacterium]|jgi:phosphatidylglycerol:prolipoprotein diacylglycerol transferase|nr:prolipoprotein diacylglyceryl transferase [Oscillospiraceae bacterium]